MSDDRILPWVRKVNDQVRKIDEIAQSVHPSAWPEAMKDDIERFRKLAASK